jgi:Cobalamin biosynthesis protein CobT VWA domain
MPPLGKKELYALGMWTDPNTAVDFSYAATGNSGSMRGGPIMSIAATALVLIGWLESWGIRVEVLGYTTRAWKGDNLLRRGWPMASHPIPVGSTIFVTWFINLLLPVFVWVILATLGSKRRQAPSVFAIC